MKFSNIIATGAAGVFALGMSASVAAAQSCTIALPFDFGSAAVSSTNQGLLDVVRTEYNGKTVDLAGYTDAVGSASANLALSKRRAQTVANYLTNGTSITVRNTTGLGESNLKVADTGPNQLNRRVEVTVPDCNPEDFGGSPLAGLGALGGAGAAAAVLGALVIVGALGDDDDAATTTTTTGGMGSGNGNGT